MQGIYLMGEEEKKDGRRMEGSESSILQDPVPTIGSLGLRGMSQ